MKCYVFVRGYPETGDQRVLVDPQGLAPKVKEELLRLCKHSLDCRAPKRDSVAIFPLDFEDDHYSVIMRFKVEPTPNAESRPAFRHVALIAFRKEFAKVCADKMLHQVLAQVDWDKPENAGAERFEARLDAGAGKQVQALEWDPQALEGGVVEVKYDGTVGRPPFERIMASFEQRSEILPEKVYSFGLAEPAVVLGREVALDVSLVAVTPPKKTVDQQLISAFGREVVFDHYRGLVCSGLLNMQRLASETIVTDDDFRVKLAEFNEQRRLVETHLQVLDSFCPKDNRISNHLDISAFSIPLPRKPGRGAPEPTVASRPYFEIGGFYSRLESNRVILPLMIVCALAMGLLVGGFAASYFNSATVQNSTVGTVVDPIDVDSGENPDGKSGIERKPEPKPPSAQSGSKGKQDTKKGIGNG